MQRHAAVFRIQDLLEEGVKKVNDVCAKFASVRNEDQSLDFNTNLEETLEL